MADIVLRNLDDDLKERLRRSAAAHRRSMNAELREIVRQALDGTPTVDASGLRQLAVEIRALSQGRAQTPSEELLRECCGGKMAGARGGVGAGRCPARP